MESLRIAEGIARAYVVSKKARLESRLAEIAEERDLDSLEIARIRARAIEAIDRGELVI